MARKKYGKPGTGRSKPQAKKGKAKDAVKFAMNPTGFAAKKVAGEVAKRVSKVNGGKATKRMAYGHGGKAAMEKAKPC